jgi:hypothetical protein
MGDWSAEDLSRAIERRRGRPRRARGIVRDDPPKPAVAWTEKDWASQFVFEYGYTARVRGVTQVCIRDTDGAVLWEGGVREIELHAEPYLGYAWFVQDGDKVRFKSALHGGAIHSAADAVRAQL